MWDAILNFLKKVGSNRQLLWGLFLGGALLLFELFNYSSTRAALEDIMGTSFTIGGVPWAAVLALGFALTDFAGVARIFTPGSEKSEEPVEIVYLFTAWLIASVLNAALTWWGVSGAMAARLAEGDTVIRSASTERLIPIVVALVVWSIRVLMIKTFSEFWDRALHPKTQKMVHNEQQGSRMTEEQAAYLRQQRMAQQMNNRRKYQ